MSTFCFYHSADLDGKCSAAIVALAMPHALMRPIDYGDPFPWDEITEEDHVVMVDFSLPPEEMCKLTQKSGAFLWIDHHKSAIDAWYGYLDELRRSNPPLYTLYHDDFVQESFLDEKAQGACTLCWKYFFPDLPQPLAIDLLGQYDVWKHDNPECLPFQYGMRLWNMDVFDPQWELLFYDNHGEGRLFKSILREGRVVLDWVTRDNVKRAKLLSHPIQFEGLNILMANQAMENSTFFDSLLDKDEYDAVGFYFWKPRIQKWVVRFYTSKPDIDLGAVALKHGGGGHKGAAGFECEILPFSLTSP